MNMTKELGELNGPILIFGGPYSNLAATRAMQKKASDLDIPANHVICTGDLVAYCAEPSETVAAIRKWGCHVVMGNCEESLALDADDCGCGFDERSSCSLLSIEWYQFSRKHLSHQHKQWMAELPRQISFHHSGMRYLVVHGSTNSINEFVFESTDNALKQTQLQNSSVDVIIGGHCGIPFGQKVEDGYWLNAGVIGMPANDGTQSGWYMIMNSVEGKVSISWHRLEYNVSDTIKEMKSHNLCQPYAQCLHSGLWPSTDILPQKELDKQGTEISLNVLEIQ